VTVCETPNGDLLPSERSAPVLKIPDSVRSTHNQDGGTVLDILHGQMFRLNPVGSRILDLLGSGYDQMRITDEISREFSIAREIVEADVQEFLATLEKHRLIERRSPMGQV
jgi:hypothetical protein